MDKIITIAGQTVGFRATARTPRAYRHIFGRDIMRDMAQLQKAFTKAVDVRKLKKPAPNASEAVKAKYEAAIQEAQLTALDLEIFENLAYTMARQYDPNVPGDADSWLDTIPGAFDIYEILPEIMELWLGDNATTSELKNR